MFKKLEKDIGSTEIHRLIVNYHSHLKIDSKNFGKKKKSWEDSGYSDGNGRKDRWCIWGGGYKKLYQWL